MLKSKYADFLFLLQTYEEKEQSGKKDCER